MSEAGAISNELSRALDPIKVAIASNAASIVPVIGSGLSSTLPGWKQLLEEIFRQHSGLLIQDFQDDFAEQLAKGELVLAADVLRRGVSQQQFAAAIKQRYGREATTNATRPAIFDQVVRIGAKHFTTTNFDQFLEDALGAHLGRMPTVKIPEQPGALSAIDVAEPPWVLKLNGCATLPSGCVLTSEGFDRRRAMPAYRAAISSLVGSRRLLFIGHSATDPSLNQLLLDWRMSTGPDEPTRHFFLGVQIKHSEAERLRRHQIEPVDYFSGNPSEPFSQLPAVLRYISAPSSSITNLSSLPPESAVRPSILIAGPSFGKMRPETPQLAGDRDDLKIASKRAALVRRAVTLFDLILDGTDDAVFSTADVRYWQATGSGATATVIRVDGALDDGLTSFAQAATTRSGSRQHGVLLGSDDPSNTSIIRSVDRALGPSKFWRSSTTPQPPSGFEPFDLATAPIVLSLEQLARFNRAEHSRIQRLGSSSEQSLETTLCRHFDLRRERTIAEIFDEPPARTTLTSAASLPSSAADGLKVPVLSLLRPSSRVWIEGSAGCGKSTLLKWLAVESSGYPDRPTLLAPLRKIDTRADCILEQIIKAALPDPIDPGFQEMLLRHFAEGTIVILLDAVDEAPERVAAALRRLTEHKSVSPRATIVVTSRPLGGQLEADLRRTNLQRTWLRGLSDGCHEAFIATLKIFQSPERSSAFIDELSKLPDSQQWMTNPTLLSIAANCFKRSGLVLTSLVELYSDVITSLLRDRAKLHDRSEEDAIECQRSLEQAFANHLFNEAVDSPSILPEEAMKLLRFPELVKESGILRANSFEVIHLSVAEFLAASRAVNDSLLGDRIVSILPSQGTRGLVSNAVVQACAMMPAHRGLITLLELSAGENALYFTDALLRALLFLGHTARGFVDKSAHTIVSRILTLFDSPSDSQALLERCLEAAQIVLETHHERLKQYRSDFEPKLRRGGWLADNAWLLLAALGEQQHWLPRSSTQLHRIVRATLRINAAAATDRWLAALRSPQLSESSLAADTKEQLQDILVQHREIAQASAPTSNNGPTLQHSTTSSISVEPGGAILTGVGDVDSSSAVEYNQGQPATTVSIALGRENRLARRLAAAMTVWDGVRHGSFTQRESLRSRPTLARFVERAYVGLLLRAEYRDSERLREGMRYIGSARAHPTVVERLASHDNRDVALGALRLLSDSGRVTDRIHAALHAEKASTICAAIQLIGDRAPYQDRLVELRAHSSEDVQMLALRALETHPNINQFLQDAMREGANMTKVRILRDGWPTDVRIDELVRIGITASEADVRAAAINACHVLTIGECLPLLSESESHNLQTLIRRLARDPATHERLAEFIAHSDAMVRWAALGSIDFIGADSDFVSRHIDKVINCVDHPDSLVRLGARTVLLSLPSAVDQLVQFLAHPEPDARSTAVVCIAKHRPDSMEWRELLWDSHDDVRMQAISALLRIEPRHAVVLAQFDRVESTRLAAALSRFRKTRDRIRTQLSTDTNPSRLAIIAEALSGDPESQPVIAEIDSLGPLVREAILRKLPEFGLSESKIRSLLVSPHEYTRAAAVRAAADVPSLWRDLIPMADDPSEAVRLSAVRELTRLSLVGRSQLIRWATERQSASDGVEALVALCRDSSVSPQDIEAIDPIHPRAVAAAHFIRLRNLRDRRSDAGALKACVEAGIEFARRLPELSDFGGIAAIVFDQGSDVAKLHYAQAEIEFVGVPPTCRSDERFRRAKSILEALASNPQSQVYYSAKHLLLHIAEIERRHRSVLH